MSTKIKQGVAVYNVFDNRLLNGFYLNEATHGKEYTDIAIKSNLSDTDSISGEYKCFYLQRDDNTDQEQLECSLTIREVKRSEGKILTFEWKNGNTIFEGTGYRVDENQIIVHYYNP